MLFPLLAASSQPRVVQVTSISYKLGSIQLDDLQMERGYTRWKAYSQSKLALLLFTRELARRSREAGWRILAAAVHPGYARTSLCLLYTSMCSGRRKTAEPWGWP